MPHLFEIVNSEGGISDVCNIIDLSESDAPDKIFELMGELIKYMGDGYGSFKIQRFQRIKACGFKTRYIVDFKKDDDWKYLQVEFIWGVGAK